MFQQPWYVMILPVLPILLVHLAGVVVAIILLVRRGGTPAILALVGFGVLFILDLASFGRGPLVELLAGQARQLVVVSTGLSCCCSVLDVAAVVCLIVAIWQAVSGPGAKGAAGPLEGAPEPVLGRWEEPPAETPFATKVLDETPEEVEGILEDPPEENPRATRVLEETLEGIVEAAEEEGPLEEGE